MRSTILVLVSLSACGGGGGEVNPSVAASTPQGGNFAANSGATSTGGVFTAAEFGGFGSGYPGGETWVSFENYKLTTAYQVAEQAITATAPVSGSATMTGYMTVNISSEEQLMGNLTVNADFASASLSGTAGDFTLLNFTPSTVSAGETLSGTLDLSNSSFSGSWITSELSGQLSGAATYDVAATPQARLYTNGSGAYTLWGSQEPGTISIDGVPPVGTLINYIARN